MARDLAGAANPSVAADCVVQTLLEVLRPDGVVIALVDPATHDLAAAATHHYATPDPNDPLLRAIISDGPRVLPRITPNARAALGLPASSAVRSWLGVPVAAGDDRTGAICLVARTPDRFASEDLAFAEAAAAQLAIAVEHGRLLEVVAAGRGDWERAVDAIGLAFCVVAGDGVIRRANRAFSLLAAVPVTAIGGRHWHDVLPRAWATPVERALRARGTGTPAELHAGTRLFTVLAFRLGGEDDGSAVLVFEDQTETRALQDQLIQSEKLSAIGQLIAGVAHDLNNPLASVIGFADFLAEDGSGAPPQLQEPLRIIRQEAERAAHIVRNLLHFARKHEGRRRAQPVGPILDATLLLLRNEFTAHKVEVVLDAEDDLPPVPVDANRIQQVVVNLLNNAVQAIGGRGTGGRVRVTATHWLDGIAVTVEDDGPGIPEEVAPRIFEPFFTTKAEGDGTGLGLSICHGIVTEHGGRITYGPRTGGGAVFRVELPGGGPPAERLTPPTTDTGRLRILVVDDEPHILHYMLATLEAWGHRVTVTADGRDALGRAMAERFDVIISDLRMAEVSGLDLYQQLARDRPDLARRVVFATGDTVRGDTLAFLESAGRPVLQKPFTLAELRAALGQAAT